MIIRKMVSIWAFATIAVISMGLLANPAQATYSLVWSDEFDGTTLNAANWTPDIGTGCPSLCGWGNNELEYYRAENVTISGGNLILTTRDESYGGASFTSGKITSRGKQTFLYGRVEMRAKIPTGGGIWPAFWMMPEDDVYGSWAASGEIDIMEAANTTTSVGGTLHFGDNWPNNASTGASYSLGGANFADDFHIYAVEWEADEMRWYVDDVLYSTKTSAQWYTNAAPGNSQAPFDQEFFIILNTAIGGNYTGCTSPGCITASLPQQFLIDYVRVYEDIPNSAPLVSITSPTADVTLPTGDITVDTTTFDADGTIDRVEFYNGSTLLGTDTTSPYGLNWPAVTDGCYTLIARVIDNLGGVGTDSIDITVGSGCGQTAYQGSPYILPMRIEAEDFDLGGPDVAYRDADLGNSGSQYRTDEDVDIEICTDIGDGYNTGWTNPGEWMEYTVQVANAGQYTINTRVSSLLGNGAFHLEINGVDVTGSVNIPATGGWQTWTTVSTTAVLNAGVQVLKFVPESVGFNVNYFDFQWDFATDVPETRSEGHLLHPCYPNPFNPSTTLSYELQAPATVSLTIYDVAGKTVKQLVAAESRAGGFHDVLWDGRDETGRVAAAGVYFYRLDAGGVSQTRRMALVK